MTRAAWLSLSFLLVLGVSLSGCATTGQNDRDGQARPKQSPPPENTESVRNATAEPAGPDASLPQAPLLFQPQFLWSDASVTREGTGFFLQAPGRRIAAVTNVQHLHAEPLEVREASWLGVRSDEPVITFTRAWGKPGDGGSMNPPDLREDYLLLPATPRRMPQDAAVLELDERPAPAEGERVWLPVKNVKATHGYRTFAGTVTAAKDTFISVSLDKPLRLASLNGSPVISQKTGKVIGALSRGGRRLDGKTMLVLTPAEALRDAIQRAESTPSLRRSFANQAQARKSATDPDAG
jgi:hypothetical protein